MKRFSILYCALVWACFLSWQSSTWNLRPLWDNLWNYAAIAYATNKPFSLFEFTVDDHICQGWFILQSVPLWFSMEYYLHNAWSGTLYSLIVFPFYGLLRTLGERKVAPLECALAASVFVFNPVVFCNGVHVTLDSGLLLFSVYYLYFLTVERLTLAACAGIGMALTKETSLVLIPLFWWLGCQLSGRRISILRALPLFIPLLSLLTVAAYKIYVWDQPAFWTGRKLDGPLSILTNMWADTSSLMNGGSLVFVLNFHWVLWGMWVSLIAWNNWKARMKPFRSGFILTVALLTAAALLIVRPFTNPRYISCVLPVLVLGVASATFLALKARIRMLIWTCVLVLQVVSAYRTIDPISKAIFGTFPFGDAQMLAITSRTRECCGYGRDQLVYNLEFLMLRKLVDAAMESFAGYADTLLVAEEEAAWHLITASRFERLLHRDSLPVQFCCAEELVALPQRAGAIYYLALPHAGRHSQSNELSKLFTLSLHKTFESGPYRVLSYSLSPRP